MDTEALEDQEYDGADLSNDLYFTSRLDKEDSFAQTITSQLEPVDLDPDFEGGTDREDA